MLQKFAIFPAKQLAISKQVTPLFASQNSYGAEPYCLNKIASGVDEDL